MGYPGNHGRSGGHPPEPHGQEQAGAGRPGQDDSPFAPSFGAFAARPGESFGTGNDQPPADDRFGPGEGGSDAGTTMQFGSDQGGRFASGTGGFDTVVPGAASPGAGGFDAAPGEQYAPGESDRFGAGTGGFATPPGEQFGSDESGRFGAGTGGFATPPGEQHGPGESGRFGTGTGGFDTVVSGAASPGAGGRFGQGAENRFGPGSFEQPGSPSFGPPGQDDPAGRGQGRHGSGGFDGPDELYGPTGEGYFAEGGGPGGFDGPREPGERPRSERRARLPLIIGGAVVAGLVLVGGGFVASTMLKDDSEDGGTASGAQTPTPTATATPTPTAPPAPLNAKLKSRATDPSPLTLKEVFGTASFTQKGKKYVRTAWKHDRSCTKTVNGSKLETALKKGGCIQVLRATYARTDGLLVGTVGVLNLKTESAAKAADKAGAGREAFLQPLAGTGYSKKIGKGAALGTTFVRGHYLIMTWVQRPDGKTISSKYHKAVSAFQQQIILGSNLSKALHYRGIEGKPLTS